ncbi:MAG: permease [Pseudomonadota bacterium]
MLWPTIVMGVLAVILLIIGFKKGDSQHIEGVKSALEMMIKIVPLLFFAFIIAGMVKSLVPAPVIAKWIGAESGMRGILIGSLAGGLMPGGPYTSLPVATVLLRSGSSMGTIVAFLTGWSLWAFARIPMEVGILGWKVTVIRFASTLIFPPIAGLIAQSLFGGVR